MQFPPILGAGCNIHYFGGDLVPTPWKASIMLEMKYYRLPSVGRVWWSTGVILGNRCIAWESTGDYI